MTREMMVGVPATDRRLSELVAMAREMTHPTDVDHTLEVVMTSSRQAFLCDAVGVLLVEDGKITTAAATEPDVERADELQVECGEGPCVEAITRQHDFIAQDLRSDSRWPTWGPRAADLGWRSILSLGLVGTGRTWGALNLYSRQESSFTTDDLALAEMFGAQASVALAGARERDGLLKAVEARHLVGQAQGILMERYSIDAAQAFTVLRRYSSHLNRKLRLVAEDIVASRQLPGA